jgi:hypothetical protein
MARREYFRVVRRSRIIWFAPAANNVVVNVDVAGQVTWTGSTAITLVATTSLPIVSKRRKRKPKRIVRGPRIQRFTPVANVVIDIDVAGQITWTGSSAITLVATTSIPITVRRRRRKPKRIVRGPRIARFTAPVAGIINVDTPGQITWTGQTIGLKTTIIPTPGAITWTGQTVGLTTNIIPTPGAITWAGSTITLIGGEPPGLPVEIPMAELLGPFGEGFLVNAEGRASLTDTEGTAQNQGEEGKAILVEV